MVMQAPKEVLARVVFVKFRNNGKVKYVNRAVLKTLQNALL